MCGCVRNTACVCCFATVCLLNGSNGAFRQESVLKSPVLNQKVTCADSLTQTTIRFKLPFISHMKNILQNVRNVTYAAVVVIVVANSRSCYRRAVNHYCIRYILLASYVRKTHIKCDRTALRTHMK